MKQRLLLSILAFLVLSGASMFAALLGVTPQLPSTTLANGSLSFAASTGAFTTTATPQAMRFDVGGNTVIKLFDSSPKSLSIGISLTPTGAVAGGRAGDDLVLRGRITAPDGTVYDGTGVVPLLTGEIIAFGFADGGTSTDAKGNVITLADLYDFRFTPTGGVMASLFANKDIAVTLQSDNGTTFTGVFTKNFAGNNVKGSLGPISLPRTECTGSIGDFVWHDENRNGVQDANEHGINGVSVTLTPDNAAIAPQTVVTANDSTGHPGYYQFRNLCSGGYTVTVTTPDGTQPTTSHVGVPATDSNGSPTTVSLPTNASTDQTIDFGFVTPCTGAIGDFVWDDENGNGVQDNGEPGVNGVTVQLLDSAGNVISTATTTNSPTSGLPGYYKFDGLCAGSYQVRVGKPADFDHISPQDQGGDDTKDSDANPTTGVALVTLPADNTTDMTIDFGLVPPCSGTIGDFVWNDLNGNGIQDAGEAGINGVLVELKDANGTIRTTNTTTFNGQPGYYQFTGLACGATYQVWVTRPGAYSQFSPTAQGTDVTVDSNGQSTVDGTYSIASVMLDNTTTHPSDQTIDFGFYACAASIGNFVWKDLNGNGIQDAGEPGIPNVTLLLQDGAGKSLGITAQTDANGYYQFTGLCPGSYTVVVLSGVPDDVEPTPSTQGTDVTVDSNGSPAAVTLTSADETNDTIDFGYKPIPPATLGNFVWEDLNHNGVQDAGEPAIAGVTVSLYICGGTTPVRTTTTDANGLYYFTDLRPGSYSVKFDAPSGYQFTTANSGSDDAADSDADATGAVPCITLAPGEVNETVDAGLFRFAALGDFVWSDSNMNGVQDAGELGIAGVPVSLYACGTSTAVLQTVTGSQGEYLFTGLVPGCYSVQFGTVSGYARTTANAGNDATDSDAAVTTGQTGNYTLASGETNRTVDAGYFALASLGDFAWIDSNGNGQQDAGEPGLGGVTVQLYACGTTAPVSTTTTAANGSYLFTNLVPGCYSVQFGSVAGYTRTAANAGNDASDSDAAVATGLTGTYTLAAGESNLTVDAGYYAPASLGDFVWNDSNMNGVQDAGELGIAGVPVSLYSCGTSTAVQQTVTGSQGEYLFTGLVPGCYSVQFGTVSGYARTTANVGNDATDSDAAVATGQTGNYTLASGETNRTVDAGYFALASLGDFAWIDSNGNGQQDAGEPGLGGVTVQLYACGTTAPVSTTTTAANGSYLFTNLVPGCYSVQFGSVAGYTRTAANVGSDTSDSDAAVATGLTGTYTLAAGESNLTVDAGYYAPASLGDFVWLDVDGDGQQDNGEPGVGGVIVNLYRCSSATVIATATTDANGKYLFSNLAPGCYVVQFGTNGYGRTVANVGSDATDSDASATNGVTGTYTLLSGQSNLTVDAGLVASSLCGYVYYDKDNDGVKDATELGIPGTTVTLTGTTSGGISVTLTTTTGTDGGYCFTNLRPGTYTITETQPSGYLDGQDTQGTPGTGTTGNDVFSSITLGAGVNGKNNNFGELKQQAYTTFTIGGWGAPPNGYNAGTLLLNNWSRLYSSNVIVGGSKTLKFTSQLAIQNFMPSGGTPAQLSKSYTNPLTTESGVFASQVLALKFNYDFSVAGLLPRNFGALKIAPGNPLAGYTIAQVLSIVNGVLGGGAPPSGLSVSALNDLCMHINGNYDNGTQDLGYLVP